MKPLFIVIFIGSFIFSMPQFCNGQSTKYQVGIEGGPSLSMVGENGYFFSTNSNIFIGLGGSIGVAFQYNFNDKIGIRTNLSFERKGWQNKSGSYHECFDYMTFPILFRDNFGKRKMFFINVGPYFSYLLSHTIELDNNNFPVDESEYDKIDLGITLAFGINIPLSNQFGLTIEIRDNLGLYDIQNGDEDAKTYLNSTIVQLGFVYNFGMK